MNRENISSPFLCFTAELASRALTKLSKEGYEQDSEGFYICPKCGTRASKMSIELGCMVTCECECRREEREKREEEQRKNALEARRLRSFTSPQMLLFTFQKDNMLNPEISAVMRAYADNFHLQKSGGRGLILYGRTGVGKTFFSGAVGNALIDNGYRVYQTSVARLESESCDVYNKQAMIDNIAYSNDLIILDDFGTERRSDYMKEFCYRVINTFYEAETPMLITTNLTADELKNPEDPEFYRIYQRILERCSPVEIANKSQRVVKFSDSFTRDKELLGF